MGWGGGPRQPPDGTTSWVCQAHRRPRPWLLGTGLGASRVPAPGELRGQDAGLTRRPLGQGSETAAHRAKGLGPTSTRESHLPPLLPLNHPSPQPVAAPPPACFPLHLFTSPLLWPLFPPAPLHCTPGELHLTGSCPSVIPARSTNVREAQEPASVPVSCGRSCT